MKYFKKRSHNASRRAVSLVELLVVIALVSVAFLGITKVMTPISQSIKTGINTVSFESSVRIGLQKLSWLFRFANDAVVPTDSGAKSIVLIRMNENEDQAAQILTFNSTSRAITISDYNLEEKKEIPGTSQVLLDNVNNLSFAYTNSGKFKTIYCNDLEMEKLNGTVLNNPLKINTQLAVNCQG